MRLITIGKEKENVQQDLKMVNTDLQKKKMGNWPTSAILAASKGENLE